MSDPTDVTIYLGIGNHSNLSYRGESLRVSSTRQELAFRPFKDPSSKPSLLSNLASEDGLLLALLFLKSKVAYTSAIDTPIALSIPFFFQYESSFMETLEGTDKPRIIKDLQDEQEKLMEEINNSGQALFIDVLRALVQDRRVVDAMKSRRRSLRGNEEFEKTISPWVKDHEERLQEQASGWFDSAMKAVQFISQELPLLQASEKIPDAKKNSDILSLVLDGDNANSFANSLSKIVIHNVFRLANESLCLECRLKKSANPYRIVEFDTQEPKFTLICPRCSGKTILHEITLTGPSTFGPLLVERSMTEVAVAKTIAKLGIFDRIFVHKKVSAMPGGLLKEGNEVDILCTSQDRLAVVEVTTSQDLSYVVPNANRKSALMKSLPIDFFIYVTLCPEVEKYLALDDGVYLTGARHIPELGAYIRHIMESKKPMPTVKVPA